MFFSISLPFLYHQHQDKQGDPDKELTIGLCVPAISFYYFCLSTAIPNYMSRTFLASESNNLYCKKIGHLKYEPESLSSLVVLSGLSILFVCCLHKPQMHKYLETKEGENSILLKYFRFSRNCRVSLVSFTWNTWCYKRQDRNKHTWETE